MKIEKFEDIISWQKSKKLSLFVCKRFANCKDYSFRDQIQRASISVMNNIAEGFERRSNKEFRMFLYIAKGSSGEVRSMANIALSLGYISGEEFSFMHDLSVEISKLISGFIKSLE